MFTYVNRNIYPSIYLLSTYLPMYHLSHFYHPGNLGGCLWGQQNWSLGSVDRPEHQTFIICTLALNKAFGPQLCPELKFSHSPGCKSSLTEARHSKFKCRVFSWQGWAEIVWGPFQIIQSWSLVLFSLLAFRNTHFPFPIPFLASCEGGNRSLDASKVNRSAAHSTCIFFSVDAHRDSFTLSFMYLCHTWNSSWSLTVFRDPRTGV